MQANVGRIDAWIRGALSVVFLILAAVFSAQPVVSLVAALVALVFAATALTHSCPLYSLLKFDTRPQDSRPQPR
jgi:hypothetical protein